MESFYNDIGLPIWNKSITFSTTSMGRGLGDDSDSVVTFIPFVKDSQNFVNASLVIKTRGDDTSFKMLYDWQYADYEFNPTIATGWSAHDVFNIFAKLDNQVFDRSEFFISDGRLFNGDSTNTFIVSIDSTYFSGRTSVLTSSTFCHTYQQCGTCLGFKTSARTSTGSYTCCFPTTAYLCTTVWTWIPDGGGTPGGGGGSTGGGGWNSPPPPCGPSARNPNPCTPGWEP